MTLSAADRELLEASVLDPAATPAYHEILGCLVWSDEVPPRLSPGGHEHVRDLLGARGYIHRGTPVENWDFGSTDRIERWNEALRSGLRWTGFQRLVLGPEHRALLERHVADQSAL